MVVESAVPEPEIELLKELPYFYEKSPCYRTIHVDGAYGGVTARADCLHITVFSERRAMPRSTTIRFENGKQQPAVDDVDTAMVRELEASLILSERAARSLHLWLEGKLKDFDGLRELANQHGKAVANIQPSRKVKSK